MASKSTTPLNQPPFFPSAIRIASLILSFSSNAYYSNAMVVKQLAPGITSNPSHCIMRRTCTQLFAQQTCSSLDETSKSLTYWERLGSPKSVMAPMVAQSDLPFRHLCRNHGTDLCFTQMIHSHNKG